MKMLRTMTGNEKFSCSPQGAAQLLMYFRNMDMKSEFAKKGVSSVVLPDERAMIDEVAQLLPTLMAHGDVESAAESATHQSSKAEELEGLIAEMRKQLGDTKESAEEIVEDLKQAAEDKLEERIEKLPKPARELARKLAAKVRQKIAEKLA